MLAAVNHDVHGVRIHEDISVEDGRNKHYGDPAEIAGTLETLPPVNPAW